MMTAEMETLVAAKMATLDRYLVVDRDGQYGPFYDPDRAKRLAAMFNGLIVRLPGQPA